MSNSLVTPAGLSARCSGDTFLPTTMVDCIHMNRSLVYPYSLPLPIRSALMLLLLASLMYGGIPARKRKYHAPVAHRTVAAAATPAAARRTLVRKTEFTGTSPPAGP